MAWSFRSTLSIFEIPGDGVEVIISYLVSHGHLLLGDVCGVGDILGYLSSGNNNTFLGLN